MASTQSYEMFTDEWYGYNEYVITCGKIACKLAGVEHDDWFGVVAALADETVCETLDQNGYDPRADFDLRSALVIDELRTIAELNGVANG